MGSGILDAPGELLFLVGTYTNAGGLGIYRCRFDTGSGALAMGSAFEGVVNPSFLAVDRSRGRLFAVNETDRADGAPGGSVSAFALDLEKGTIKAVNRRSSRGADPCHLTLDRSGRWVLVANYSGGNVAVLPVAADGTLGEATDVAQHHGSGADPKRQEKPHAHSVYLDGPNQFAYAADLGTDRIMISRFDARKGKLTPAQVPFAPLRPGSGPRHIAFHPGGAELYVANELGSTLTRFGIDRSTGALEERQTIATTPEGFTGTNYPAEVAVGPGGRFVYVSNRGHDSIAVCALEGRSGALTAIQHQSVEGSWPRHFVIDPSGRFLLVANQRSNAITVLALDEEKGTLSPTGKRLEIPSPVCVQFVA